MCPRPPACAPPSVPCSASWFTENCRSLSGTRRSLSEMAPAEGLSQARDAPPDTHVHRCVHTHACGTRRDWSARAFLLVHGAPCLHICRTCVCVCTHTHTHFPLHLSLSTHSLKHYFLFTEHVCRVEGAHGLAPERRSLRLPHCPSHPREARPFRVCGTHLSVRLSLPADRKRRCFCPSGKPRLPLAHVHAEMSALLRMGSRLRREQQVSEFLALKEIVYLQ